MFEVLPYEVIAKILSQLDLKQYVSTSLISKDYNKLYDEYFTQIIKEKLTGTYVENINCKQRLKDIYKSIHLNNRIYECDLFQYIVGSDGKIYILCEDSYVDKFYYDIDNIIAVSGEKNGRCIFLRNDGQAYVYDSNYDYDPELVCDYQTNSLTNVIQIVSTYECFLFLTSKGQVYAKKYYSSLNEDIIYAKLLCKDIIKIYANSYCILFLDRYGNVHKYNDGITTKIESFKNVKQLFTYNLTMIVALSEDKTIRVYDKDFTEILCTTFTNINKIKNIGGYFLFLNDNNLYESILYRFGFSSKELIQHDVIDFYANMGETCMLTKGNKLMINILSEKKTYTYNNTKSIQLLDNRLIFMDKNLYIVLNKNNCDDLQLIKIC